MKTLIIVRTHRADADTFSAFDRYGALRSADAVIGCDERDGIVDTGGRAKFGFDAGVLQALGVFQHPACGWRCGDYFYYAARSARPDYEFYWLIEPDVLINTADLDTMFEALNAAEADLLAPHFGPRDERWGWHKTMRGSYPEIYGCIFPITRLSARAIDHLHAVRRSAPTPDTAAELTNWPNDEVFVATVLQNDGFTCHELGQANPDWYSRHTLRTGTPWDRASLGSQPPDGRIYHPVRHFMAWFEGQSRRLSDYAVQRRGRRQAHFRPDLMSLVRLAYASLSVEGLQQAAFFPLMVASRMTLEAWLEPVPGEADAYIEAEVRHEGAVRTLFRCFAPRGHRREFATGYLLAPAGHDPSADMAAQADFTMDHSQPLHTLPVTFALPYAYDLADASLMFTVHPLPSAILAADSMLEEQRRQACVAYRIELRHLHHFYPLPAEFPAISFLVINGMAERADALQRLRSAGIRAVADPTALMQIARQSGRFLRLRRRWWRPVLWSAIAPIFMTYGATCEPVVFVVSNHILSIRRLLRALLANVEFCYDIDSAAARKSQSARARAAGHVTPEGDRTSPGDDLAECG